MTDIDLTPFRHAIKSLNEAKAVEGEFSELRLFFWRWLGDRAHLLVSEIERLRAEVSTK